MEDRVTGFQGPSTPIHKSTMLNEHWILSNIASKFTSFDAQFDKKHPLNKASRDVRTAGGGASSFSTAWRCWRAFVVFCRMPIMGTSDVWDNTPGTQRKETRYLARWKVTLVFDTASKKPPFQTLTHDLSLTGISVQYHSEEKAHTVVALLLALPPLEGVPRKVIKLKAEVTSSVPFRGGFRLGMSFIQDAELDKLRQSLEMYVVTDRSLISDPEAEEFPILNL